MMIDPCEPSARFVSRPVVMQRQARDGTGDGWKPEPANANNAYFRLPP